jgi:hypothetical protein
METVSYNEDLENCSSSPYLYQCLERHKCSLQTRRQSLRRDPCPLLRLGLPIRLVSSRNKPLEFSPASAIRDSSRSLSAWTTSGTSSSTTSKTTTLRDHALPWMKSMSSSMTRGASARSVLYLPNREISPQPTSLAQAGTSAVLSAIIPAVSTKAPGRT